MSLARPLASVAPGSHGVTALASGRLRRGRKTLINKEGGFRRTLGVGRRTEHKITVSALWVERVGAGGKVAAV